MKVKENEKRKNSFQEKLAIILGLQYILITLKNILTATNSNIMQYNDLLNLGLIAIFLISYSIIAITHSEFIFFNKTQLIIIVSILTFWLLSIMVNNNLVKHPQVISYIRSFTAYSLTAIVFLPMLDDPKRFIDKLVKFAYYVSFLALIGIVYFFIFEYHTTTDPYNMSFGGSVAFLTILLIYDVIRKFSLVKLFIIIFFTFVIVLYGSRTPLVVIFSFLFLHIISEKLTAKKVIIYLFSFLILLVLLININVIVKYLYELFLSLGFYSRTLDLFVTGNIAQDTGRFDIYKVLWPKILESPYIGYGAAGSSLIVAHGQAHSLFLDVFVNMGLIFGALFFIIISIFTIKSYKQSNKETRKFIFLLIASFFPIGFIQQSLWGSDSLWLLIALNITILNSMEFKNKGIRKKTTTDEIGIIINEN